MNVGQATTWGDLFHSEDRRAPKYQRPKIQSKAAYDAIMNVSSGTARGNGQAKSLWMTCRPMERPARRGSIQDVLQPSICRVGAGDFQLLQGRQHVVSNVFASSRRREAAISQVAQGADGLLDLG